jgi:hypothetical protein
MIIATETVQVELVNAWWEQVIPVAALVISLFSVTLTLVYRYFDRLNLKVSASWTPVVTSSMQPFVGLDRITVEVTNRSRSATTEVTALALRTKDGKSFRQEGRRWPTDSDLPLSLGPGQTASRSFSAQSVGDTLNTQALGVHWVQGIAISGHKTVLSKRRRDLVQRLREYATEHPPRSPRPAEASPAAP